MKISYNWLKTLLPIELPAEDTAKLLTDAGLEVESIEKYESIKGGLEGLIVGEVKSCSKHPDADRLSLTLVDIGREKPLEIVCGAPNVADGQKVIVATVGTKLYPLSGDPFEIKKSKIRGAVSEGMICAEDEIGVGNSHAGIMVLPPETPVGLPASQYFKIETDHVFEIGLTPNRSDAASHLGVARDLAAVLNVKDQALNLAVKMPTVKELPSPTNTNTIKIRIENKEACRRYSGIVLSGISVKESPSWLRHRLLSIGLRPINNIVDITNYVLHELGQPLHAFDFEQIGGQEIVVRSAHEKEPFETLDGIKRELHANDLVIADQRSPMCLAGIFGGIHSGVTEKTNAIFLESAYFDAGSIRRSSKAHALKTDASFRFERGTDPEMTVAALQRAAMLILELAGGVVSSGLSDLVTEKPEPNKVAFSYHNCRELIGKDIDKNTIRQIITQLGIRIESEGNDGLLLAVPLFKTDVTREADVIEEVMRIYGYNNVEESRHISYSAGDLHKNPEVALEEKIGELLVNNGYYETLGLSLSNAGYYPENAPLVKVVNPLSNDLNVMRYNLLFGGLEILAHNINRKTEDLKIYEIGRTYSFENNTYTEKKALSLFVTGALFPPNAYGLKQDNGFAYLKGTVESILKKCGISKYSLTEKTTANYSQSLSIEYNNKTLGLIAEVDKKLLKQNEIHQPVFHATIDWAVLGKLATRQQIQFTELVKFPSVRRDLALLIDRSVKYQDIESLAYSTERKFLQEVTLFDVYEGEKLGNKKSYAVSFTLQNKEATLTEKQIEAVMEKLIATYREKLGAELR